MSVETKPKGKWITIYDNTHTRFMLKFWQDQQQMVSHIVRDMDIRVFNVRICYFAKRAENGASINLVSGNSIDQTRIELITKTAYNVCSKIQAVTDDAVFVDGEFFKFDVYTMDAQVLSNVIGNDIFYDIVEDLIVDVRDTNGQSYKIQDEEDQLPLDDTSDEEEEVAGQNGAETSENSDQEEVDISALTLSNDK